MRDGNGQKTFLQNHGSNLAFSMHLAIYPQSEPPAGDGEGEAALASPDCNDALSPVCLLNGSKLPVVRRVPQKRGASHSPRALSARCADVSQSEAVMPPST